MTESQRDKVTDVSTHSRLKAAGRLFQTEIQAFQVSTHSRLKAAGCSTYLISIPFLVSTHSRLKAAGLSSVVDVKSDDVFQHTAA